MSAGTLSAKPLPELWLSRAVVTLNAVLGVNSRQERPA